MPAPGEVILKKKLKADSSDMDVAMQALQQFDRICKKLGVPSREKDEIWQMVAILCAHQVRHRYGTFYECVKEILLQ